MATDHTGLWSRMSTSDRPATGVTDPGRHVHVSGAASLTVTVAVYDRRATAAVSSAILARMSASVAEASENTLNPRIESCHTQPNGISPDTSSEEGAYWMRGCIAGSW